MNRITVANGDIGFNFTDSNLIKRVFIDKLIQAQLTSGRLVIIHLLVDNDSKGECTTTPAGITSKIVQHDTSSIVLYSTLSAEEQDEDGPYVDLKVLDGLM